MDMPTTKVEVMSVKPVEFDVIIGAKSYQDMDSWVSELERKHACVGATHVEWRHVSSADSDEDSDELIACIRILVDEDADYRQLCALRAELKA